MKKIEGYQVDRNQGVLLNANESFINLEDTMVEEIKASMDSVLFQRYPDDTSEKLRQAYGSYIEKSKEEIIVGNGSDEMLGLLIGLHIKEGKKLYTLCPDFSMYDYYVSMQGGEVCTYKCGAQDTFNVDEFIARGKSLGVDLIIFSNPNNPTGKSISTQDICTIVEAFKDIYVVVDEAYADFADNTMLAYTDTYANLLVTRTLSKAFALAGARVGFLVGCKESIARIASYKVPYNVNVMSQNVACIVLKYTDLIHARIAYTRRERDTLYQAFTQMNKKNITLYKSDANYLYGICNDMDALTASFQQKGIVIRYYKDNSFRITIGTNEENAQVLEVLKNY